MLVEPGAASEATVPVFTRAMVVVIPASAIWNTLGKLEAVAEPLLVTGAEKEVLWPGVGEAGVGVVAPAVRSGIPPTERLLPQAAVVETPPEVTVTEAVLVPVVEYVFVTLAVVPVKVSVPVHEYVYVPVPPEAVAVHVAEPPAVMEVGETEQEAASVEGNVAETNRAAVIDTVQVVAVPVQSPPHPEKPYPGDGAAVRVTEVPWLYNWLQSVPQEMPAGLEVTVPCPPFVTLRLYVSAVKVAVTLFDAVIETVQVPVPVHAPDQPEKIEPTAGAAVSVTEVF